MPMYEFKCPQDGSLKTVKRHVDMRNDPVFCYEEHAFLVQMQRVYSSFRFHMGTEHVDSVIPSSDTRYRPGTINTQDTRKSSRKGGLVS